MVIVCPDRDPRPPNNTGRAQKALLNTHAIPNHLQPLFPHSPPYTEECYAGHLAAVGRRKQPSSTSTTSANYRDATTPSLKPSAHQRNPTDRLRSAAAAFPDVLRGDLWVGSCPFSRGDTHKDSKHLGPTGSHLDSRTWLGFKPVWASEQYHWTLIRCL